MRAMARQHTGEGRRAPTGRRRHANRSALTFRRWVPSDLDVPR
jgi:hypothetical protein